jgi:hypothetical protein
MTKKEIEQKMAKNRGDIRSWTETKDRATEAISQLEKDMAWLKSELKELNRFKIYEPILIQKIPLQKVFEEEHLDYNLRVDRYNANEELKRLISIENADRRWKVDWSEKQDNYYIEAYEVGSEKVFVDSRRYERSQEDELYFSLVSAEDKNFIDKITPFWLKAKGISGR